MDVSLKQHHSILKIPQLWLSMKRIKLNIVIPPPLHPHLFPWYQLLHTRQPEIQKNVSFLITAHDEWNCVWAGGPDTGPGESNA